MLRLLFQFKTWNPQFIAGFWFSLLNPNQMKIQYKKYKKYLHVGNNLSLNSVTFCQQEIIWFNR